MFRGGGTTSLMRAWPVQPWEDWERTMSMHIGTWREAAKWQEPGSSWCYQATGEGVMDKQMRGKSQLNMKRNFFILSVEVHWTDCSERLCSFPRCRCSRPIWPQSCAMQGSWSRWPTVVPPLCILWLCETLLATFCFGFALCLQNNHEELYKPLNIFLSLYPQRTYLPPSF